MGRATKTHHVLRSGRHYRENTPMAPASTGVKPNAVAFHASNPRASHPRLSSAKSFFFDTIRHGPVKKARELLKEMPRLAQTTDNLGYTPLHYAALSGPAELVQDLHEANANIDAQDHSGNTPLHCSCAEMAAVLIAMNANIESRNLDGSTALHLAANKGQKGKVGALLAANANVLAQDTLNNTPLHYAARAGHHEVVKMVLERGENVDSVNKLGMTPLSLAIAEPCRNRLERIVSLLLSANADVNIPNKDGNTPLHHAAMNQNLKILKLLLHGGGNLHLANRKGLTVWDLVQRRHEMKKAISETLLEIAQKRLDTTLKVDGPWTMVAHISRSA